jgi:hypothetical protein
MIQAIRLSERTGTFQKNEPAISVFVAGELGRASKLRRRRGLPHPAALSGKRRRKQCQADAAEEDVRMEDRTAAYLERSQCPAHQAG